MGAELTLRGWSEMLTVDEGDSPMKAATADLQMSQDVGLANSVVECVVALVKPGLLLPHGIRRREPVLLLDDGVRGRLECQYVPTAGGWSSKTN